MVCRASDECDARDGRASDARRSRRRMRGIYGYSPGRREESHGVLRLTAKATYCGTYATQDILMLNPVYEKIYD